MKILITDDHDLFIDGLQMVLRDITPDVECLVAHSADRALALIEENPDIDIALIDLYMPDTDGISLINKIGSLQLGIPTVLVSATDEAHRIKAALQAGALGFIPKSASREYLYSVIEGVLGGKVCLPEEIAREVALISQSRKFTEMTDRQKTVLHLIAKGYQNKHIADALSLTENTVKFHIKCLFTKFKSRNRTECVEAAKTLGLL